MNVKNNHVHTIHDKGYKLLLSSKRIFVELLQSFVNKEWVSHIDEKQLTKIDKSYILQDFREKEADLVYEMRMQNKPVLFYILMEMQSTVDFQMPYRLLLYMVEIWRDVMKNADPAERSRKGFRLPSIVPIVLYNGSSPWTVCRCFRETLDGAEWFGDELLDFKYILMDIHQYGEQQLLQLSNLIGCVFLLDRKPDVPTFVKQLEQLSMKLAQLPNDAFHLFQAWLKLMTSHRLDDEQKQRVSQVIDQYENPEEASQMVSNLEKAFADFEVKAEQRGKQRGISEGMEKGIRKVAQRMLKQGKDIASIMEATELTEEEVEKIKMLHECL